MNNLRRIILLSLIIVSFRHLGAQEYTPYDDFPGIIKSYKPAWDENYPEWAKMLYKHPVNYKQVCSDFDAYMQNHPGEKSPIIRYMKIWRRAVESYVRADGSIELPNTDQILQKLRNRQLSTGRELKSASLSSANWSFLGPKNTYWLNESGAAEIPKDCPWQVNVYSFDVAASDNNIIYCGTETGFVNKTTDKGLNWQQVGLNYPFGGGITAVAIDPSNADVVYVAASKQIHKTSNGGATWIPILSGTGFHADRLKIDPRNPQKLVAAASDGIYVSSNGGGNWSKSWSYQCWDVEIKPDDSNVIVAVTKDSSNNFKIVVSENGGTSFAVVSNFPVYKNESGALLAMTPANPNIVYAALLSSEGAEKLPYILKGTRNGSSWSWVQTKKGEYSSVGGLGGFTNGQGYFDLVLEASPTNADMLFFGTCTLWKSTNGGTSFSAVGGYRGNFSIHPDQQDLKILPNGETWAATDGGMNLSTDYFVNADNHSSRTNGIVGSDMWGFDQGWNEDIVIGGRYHNGNTAISDLYKSKALRMGGAESPTGWVLKGKSRHVAFNDLGSGWILPKTAEGKPEGRFIFSKFPNMDGYGSRRGNIAHHPNYFGILYIGEGNSIWKSTDSGVSYDMLYAFPDKVRYLDISYSNPNVIYADVDNNGLYKSTDGGKNWVLKYSLTGEGGRSKWAGRVFFAISPSNENALYACYQNDAWSAQQGTVMRSLDGGSSWEQWGPSEMGVTKCVVVQPDAEGKDLVYLFTNSKNGETARVYYRTSSMNDWAFYDTGYPAGMDVIMAMPFFRDSKLRVGGSAGVWESPLVVTDFAPIFTPWVEKQNYNCMLDTVCFEDHSILNHQGASWEWSFSPEPKYISDSKVRNPKVVFGKEGAYDVTMTVTQNGKSYSKTIEKMVTLTTCPSVDDCSNPAELPKKDWQLIYVDSEDISSGGAAVKAFDGDPATIWHTRWSTGVDNYPHEIQIDLGKKYNIHQFSYLARQNGVNGTIKNYELYISDDKTKWGNAVKVGSFENTKAPQKVVFSEPKAGRYFRLKALSEVNGGAWSSAAELTMIGCNDVVSGINMPEMEEISAYPVPTSGIVRFSLPNAKGESFQYSIYSSTGQKIQHGAIGRAELDLSALRNGVYIIHLAGSGENVYRVKVVKQ